MSRNQCALATAATSEALVRPLSKIVQMRRYGTQRAKKCAVKQFFVFPTRYTD